MGNELNMFFRFSDPENPILDTKITSLRSIVPEENELVWFVGHLLVWFVGHLERHLEYLETARVSEVIPSFFLKQVLFWRDWHPWHICIISQPTGILLAARLVLNDGDDCSRVRDKEDRSVAILGTHLIRALDSGFALGEPPKEGPVSASVVCPQKLL